jgi:ubiquitin carboxyl-terminal hydrolase 4/11/15
MIRRKILEKIATFTTSHEFEDDDDEASGSAADSLDPDTVITNGSDSSEGKIAANSVDGEDGLVDVSMNGAGVANAAVAGNTAKTADRESR